MAAQVLGDELATHAVANQSPPFEGRNLYLTDKPLMEAVKREGGGFATNRLVSLGARAGSVESFEMGRLANENPPKLRRFDQKGAALDVVDFHPAYHDAMAMSIKEGLHCSTWDHLRDGADAKPRVGAHVARAAGLYITTQMEPGHVCPVTMTHAAVPTLLLQPSLAQAWLPLILSRTYDKAFKPWTTKTGVTLGMGMTEKQGGTDIRENTTAASPIGTGGPGSAYVLVGHKWFLSAPMCDGFLVLAQAPRGLSCFLVPRFLPDDAVNPLRLQRLKDKLGNRSNASAEVEFHGALGWLVGEEGRGIVTIIEMVTHTRLDCAAASAAQMRLALAQALYHCRHRTVFQKKLADQPLMMEVLADMALDVEAAAALVMRLARSFDGAASGPKGGHRTTADPAETAWRRLMTPVVKYWVCKMAPPLVTEAMECLGGNGYVEDGMMARLYREAPLNAIWEGSGNVMCLDVLRVLQRDGEAAGIVLDELDAGAKGDRRLEAHIERVRQHLTDARYLDTRTRTLVEGLALAAAASLLRTHAPSAVADAFIASRLSGSFRHTYGAGTAGGPHADGHVILERALPSQ